MSILKCWNQNNWKKCKRKSQGKRKDEKRELEEGNKTIREESEREEKGGKGKGKLQGISFDPTITVSSV